MTTRKITYIFFHVALLFCFSTMARTPQEKCGTIEVLKAMADESDEITREFLDYKRITRPSMAYQYDTPSGHFRIHYDTTGYHAVDSIEYVHQMGEYLDYCWALYIDTLGYLAPPSDSTMGGSSNYDIYLKNISSYGLTWPGSDGPQPWLDYTSYIEIHNTFSTAYPNDDPEGPVAGAMKITCAHEFHHAIQFGMRGDNTVWMAELTSVSMEDRVYPMVNDYVWLIDYFTESPNLPIDYSAGYHMYGLGILPQYWHRIYGDDFLFSVWDTMIHETDFDALEIISQNYGTNLGIQLARFGVYAALIGSINTGFFSDGAAFEDMFIDQIHSSYPASGEPDFPPYGYGLSYVLFQDFGSESHDLYIEFDGEDGIDWEVYAGKVVGDSVELFECYIGDFGEGAVQVPSIQDAYLCLLSIVPTGNTSSTYDFTYEARLVACDLTEVDRPEIYSMRVSPNPFNCSCQIDIKANSLARNESLEIYDIGGRKIAELKLENSGENSYRATWNGEDSSGKPVSSGIYFAGTPFTQDFIRLVLLK